MRSSFGRSIRWLHGLKRSAESWWLPRPTHRSKTSSPIGHARQRPSYACGPGRPRAAGHALRPVVPAWDLPASLKVTAACGVAPENPTRFLYAATISRERTAPPAVTVLFIPNGCASWLAKVEGHCLVSRGTIAGTPLRRLLCSIRSIPRPDRPMTVLAKLGAALIEAKRAGKDLDRAVAISVGWDQLAANVAEANRQWRAIE